MAPRRRTERFLGSLVKTTSTRAIALVLVAAGVLFLSGCGGGDDSSDTAATGATSTGAAEAGKAADGGAKRKGAGNLEKQSGGEGAGTKQGSKVPQPEGEPEPGITPEQRSNATIANIKLESPTFKPGAALPATYTCDGEDIWPELHWSGLPLKAAELVLMVMNLRPVEEELFFDWAVAGIDPGLASIEEGKLPSGAVVGENSLGERGYSICPNKGQSENYIFALYAIPKALNPSPGFDPLKLREEVIAQSGNAGLLAVSYKH